jgi:hypothetical protein
MGMNEIDMHRVTSASNEPYSSDLLEPNPNFLHILQEFAAAGKIAEFAQACDIYINAHARLQGPVERRVPPILWNTYLVTLAGFDLDRLFRWQQKTPDWAEPLQKYCRDADQLTLAVERIRDSVAATA